MTDIGVVPYPPAANHSDRIYRSAHDPHAVRNLWSVFGAVLILLFVIRVVSIACSLFITRPHQTEPNTPSKDVETLSVKHPASSIFTRIPRAIGALFKIVACRWMVSLSSTYSVSFGEIIFILLYMAVCFTLLFVDTKGGKPSLWEDRAAHIGASQVPIVVALAGKNNIVSLLTGIGHERLNILHRASSRVCLLLLWLHALTRYFNVLPPIFNFSHGFVKAGAVGLGAFTLAAITSVRLVRSKYFEFFLLAHILFIAIFLIAGYIHVDHSGVGYYIWPAFILWGLDRFLRGFRLVWNNRVWSKKEFQEATIETLCSNTVRLTMRRHMSWKAGQHVYVTFPNLADFPTQAHPFTIASISDGLDGGPGPEEKEIALIVRGQGGLTRRLLEYNGERDKVTALIDGPYGTPPNLAGFETCVLVAGGSGISYTLSLLRDCIHKARAGKSVTKRVVFVWSFRELECLSWISASLNEALEAAPKSLVVEARIYVTGSHDTSLKLLTTREKAKDTGIMVLVTEAGGNLLAHNGLQVLYGRPHIPTLLQDVIHSCSGSVSIDVAGPYGLSQSVRRTLSSFKLAGPSAVMKGGASVTLHVENFGM